MCCVVQGSYTNVLSWETDGWLLFSAALSLLLLVVTCCLGWQHSKTWCVIAGICYTLCPLLFLLCCLGRLHKDLICSVCGNWCWLLFLFVLLSRVATQRPDQSVETDAHCCFCLFCCLGWVPKDLTCLVCGNMCVIAAQCFTPSADCCFCLFCCLGWLCRDLTCSDCGNWCWRLFLSVLLSRAAIQRPDQSVETDAHCCFCLFCCLGHPHKDLTCPVCGNLCKIAAWCKTHLYWLLFLFVLLSGVATQRPDLFYLWTCVWLLHSASLFVVVVCCIGGYTKIWLVLFVKTDAWLLHGVRHVSAHRCFCCLGQLHKGLTCPVCGNLCVIAAQCYTLCSLLFLLCCLGRLHKDLTHPVCGNLCVTAAQCYALCSLLFLLCCLGRLHKDLTCPVCGNWWVIAAQRFTPSIHSHSGQQKFIWQSSGGCSALVRVTQLGRIKI